MFHKSELSSKNRAELKVAEDEILRVSSIKPLGYLEKGVYHGQLISPRCIRYVPKKLIDTLMAKKDIYILSPRDDGKKRIEWKSPHADSPNIILLDALSDSDQAPAGNHTMVFHKEALKKLLECNKRIVLSMLNREKFFRDAKNAVRSTKENSLQMIDDSAVLAFVELVGRRDFSSSSHEKALIDAAFADANLFFQNQNWHKIRLTPELNESFMQSHFSQWQGVDWAAIQKEYLDAKAIIRSSESRALIKNVISYLAKGYKDVHFIDEINRYIKKYPDRRLSQIILPKIQQAQQEAAVKTEMKYR